MEINNFPGIHAIKPTEDVDKIILGCPTENWSFHFYSLTINDIMMPVN